MESTASSIINVDGSLINSNGRTFMPTRLVELVPESCPCGHYSFEGYKPIRFNRESGRRISKNCGANAKICHFGESKYRCSRTFLGMTYFCTSSLLSISVIFKFI